MMIMKEKIKEWWSSIPPISTKQTSTSHLNSLNFLALSWFQPVFTLLLLNSVLLLVEKQQIPMLLSLPDQGQNTKSITQEEHPLHHPCYLLHHPSITPPMLSITPPFHYTTLAVSFERYFSIKANIKYKTQLLTIFCYQSIKYWA